MIRRLLTIACGLMLVFGSGSLRAAEIEARTEDGHSVVFVVGEINPDDGEKFARVVTSLQDAIVILGSPGGSLLAGLRMGQLIRNRGFVTFVPDNTFCASACAFAWLGGVTRFLQPTARIGFHAAYVVRNGRKQETGAGNALAGAYLSRLGLSDSAVLYISSAAPDEITWLTRRDALRVGIDISMLEPFDTKPDAPGAKAAPPRSSDRQASAPHAPPPAPRPERAAPPDDRAALYDRASAFVDRYFSTWSDSNDRAMAAFKTFYSARVDFYGSTSDRQTILQQKQLFAERWPERVYAVRGDTVTATCDETSRECLIKGTVAWDARSSSRAVRSTGTAKFALTIDMAGRQPQITAETGAVLSRETSQVP